MTPEQDAPTPPAPPPPPSPRLSSAGAHSAVDAGTPAAAAFSSSLDPSKESDSRVGLDLVNPHYLTPEFSIEPLSSWESSFRHSGWKRHRQAVWEALQRTGAGRGTLEAFSTCGSALWLEVSAGNDDIRCRCNQCRNRFCIPCSVARRARMQAAILDAVAGTPLRFVTLTMRHNQTPLTEQIDRLYRCFATLRRRAFWKDCVKGGGAFLEVKVGRDQLWHVHLHLLLEGSFIDQRKLSQEWHAVTGDSSIVDIRSIPQTETAVAYVTKYVTKPASVDVLNDPARLDEMIVSIKGRHVCLTFGTWRGLALNDPPPDGREWKYVGRVENLHARACEGDPEAIRWICALSRKYPLFAPLLALKPRSPPPDDAPF